MDPSEGILLVFGSDKVELFGVYLGEKALWSQVYHQNPLNTIEHRDSSTFTQGPARSSTRMPGTSIDMRPMQQVVHDANKMASFGSMWNLLAHLLLQLSNGTSAMPFRLQVADIKMEPGVNSGRNIR